MSSIIYIPTACAVQFRPLELRSTGRISAAVNFFLKDDRSGVPVRSMEDAWDFLGKVKATYDALLDSSITQEQRERVAALGYAPSQNVPPLTMPRAAVRRGHIQFIRTSQGRRSQGRMLEALLQNIS